MTLYSSIVFIVIVIIFLIALLFFIASKKEQSVKSIEGDEEEITRRAKEKTNSIIRTAIGRANDMLVEAELKGIQTVAERKLEVERYEHVYEKDLENLLGTTLGEFVAATQNMLTRYRQHLTSIEETMAKTTNSEEEKLKNHFVTLNQTVEKSFVQYLNNAQASFERRISEDIEKMEQKLQLYEEQKQKVIDEQIVLLVEETTKRVLGKTLNLKDHIELVYKALNEARNSGLIQIDSENGKRVNV